MKIVQVCPKYLPERDGIITHVREISERLAARGHEVEVYTTDPSGKLAKKKNLNGVVVRRFKSWAPLTLYHFSIPLLQALKQANCEILHCHGYQDFPVLASILVKDGRKSLVTLHSGMPLTPVTRMLNKPYCFLIGRGLRNFEKILFVSRFEMLHFTGLCGFHSSKTIILPNGVDTNRLTKPHRWPSAIPREERYILSVSGLRKYKGHDLLIRGFAKSNLLKQLGVKLVIAGRGDYKDSLDGLVRKLGLANRVFIIDTATDSEIASLYEECACFVLLSRYEGQPISVIEAISANKPVIVSLAPGLADFAREGNARGISYPPKLECLAEMLEETISKPDKFLPRNTHQISWDQVTDSLEKIYRDLVSRPMHKEIVGRALD